MTRDLLYLLLFLGVIGISIWLIYNALFFNEKSVASFKRANEALEAAQKLKEQQTTQQKEYGFK